MAVVQTPSIAPSKAPWTTSVVQTTNRAGNLVDTHNKQIGSLETSAESVEAVEVLPPPQAEQAVPNQIKCKAYLKK